MAFQRLRAPEAAVVPDNETFAAENDLLCLSHLRWDFVFQRPQHLMTRFARRRRVFFMEEPIYDGNAAPALHVSKRNDRIHLVVPHLPQEMRGREQEIVSIQSHLVNELVASHQLTSFALWYYTPMAIPFTIGLAPAAIVYDCMDELSGFAGAHPALPFLETILIRYADLVLTGGHSLYRAKRHLHSNIHPFPSSVDLEHFAKARAPHHDPADQADIPRPRAGFMGVIDERLNLELLGAVAEARPDIQFVMLGPIAKIDPASVPRLPNVRYLGQKDYRELPAYLAGWDVAMMPFAHNASTRFISPTKTLEYLAAGKPIISTSIPDVVDPFGQAGLAHIADTAGEFVAALESFVASRRPGQQRQIDAFLAQHSWDATWTSMNQLLELAIERRRELPTSRPTPIFGMEAQSGK